MACHLQLALLITVQTPSAAGLQSAFVRIYRHKAPFQAAVIAQPKKTSVSITGVSPTNKQKQADRRLVMTLPRRKALISSAEDVFSRLSLSLFLGVFTVALWSALLCDAGLRAYRGQKVLAEQHMYMASCRGNVTFRWIRSLQPFAVGGDTVLW